MRHKLFILLFTFGIASSDYLFAQAPVVVKVDKPVSEIQPTMWGIFFEDINFAADGGIYAELIKNRSFEFDSPLMGWSQPNSDLHSLNQQSGYASVIKTGDMPNSRFIRIELKNAEGYSLINEGFRGIGIKKDSTYNLSIMCRQHGKGISRIHFNLINAKGEVLGATQISPDSEDWKKYQSVFTVSATEPKASLKITFEGEGVIDLDMISLFPKDTWKGRPNGLRKDLAQLLADLQPGFLRFPGGCIVEGRTLARRYQWKKTIGNPGDRQMIVNRWNTEFAHRPTPDYFQTFGLGFYEYFLLAEDIKAEPLPILSCGMACQFNTGELVPLDELDPYVQDALDLIEFANGSADTEWGKKRTEMGHPEPFNLKFIGVGNEQWGKEYFDRLKIFTQAIKAKYPEMTIVSGTGPFPDGEHFDYAEKELRDMKAEIVDEHYYRSPEWFLQNADRYDSYDRDSYKIFAGEYAAQSVDVTSPENKNNWRCAMSEAAFMTGLERNADVVWLTSYAPLFAHVDGWQWTPDLIWFDNLSSFGTANYQVQKLFSNNRGTHLLSITCQEKPLTGQDDLYASAVIDKDAGVIILKLVNASDKPQSRSISLEGIKKVQLTAKAIILRSDDPEMYNTIDKPKEVFPEEKDIKIKGNKVDATLDPYSLTVLRIKM